MTATSEKNLNFFPQCGNPNWLRAFKLLCVLRTTYGTYVLERCLSMLHFLELHIKKYVIPRTCHRWLPMWSGGSWHWGSTWTWLGNTGRSRSTSPAPRLPSGWTHHPEELPRDVFLDSISTMVSKTRLSFAPRRKSSHTEMVEKTV